jgi:hypothetical protein
VTVWNRTDCCSDRLDDYWIFVSDAPFAASDTPATLRSRANTWWIHPQSAPNPSATFGVSANFGVPGAQGRYVRIQLNGTNSLSLAEVQIYAP